MENKTGSESHSGNPREYSSGGGGGACLKLILHIVQYTKATISRDIFISTNVCHPAFVAGRPVDSLPADVRQENQYLQFLYIVFCLFVFSHLFSSSLKVVFYLD